MAGGSKKVIIDALVANLLIAVTKFIAAAVTASSAMLSEGINSSSGGIDSINEILTLHIGPTYILTTISIDFKDEIPAGKIEETINDITKKIKQAHPSIRRVFIEAEKPARS